jgi:hypothetical protein
MRGRFSSSASAASTALTPAPVSKMKYCGPEPFSASGTKNWPRS